MAKGVSDIKKTIPSTGNGSNTKMFEANLLLNSIVMNKNES
jgi:hypothetical protein